MTFQAQGETFARVGVLVGSELLAFPAETSLIDLFDQDLDQSGAEIVRSPDRRFDLDSVTVLPPILDPPAVRDFMAFEQHVEAGARAGTFEIPEVWYRLPVFYFSNPSSLFGAYEEVEIFPGCESFDFELEVACIIGTEARDVLAEDADAYVAGYTILCDWSARDVQFEEMSARLGPAKGKDGATTVGPSMVTPEEIVDRKTEKGYDLAMRSFLNGELIGQDLWSNVRFSFGEMIERASRGTRLRPGDVLGSGTCGAGCLAELRVDDPDRDWLRPGDVLRLEIDRLGFIESRIAPARSGADVGVQKR